jgi:acetolactate synthase small subunit
MPSSPPLAAADADGDPQRSAVVFSIHARAEPGVMPRIVELFAKRGLVPQHWSSAVAQSVLTIDLEMTGIDRDLAAYIARSMRQIVGVDSVLTSSG